MRWRARLLCLAFAALPATATQAQAIARSDRPDSVAVTVYRDPYNARGNLNLNWLNGYALISETRRVSIPAGEGELRFEGVAGGILPQSAIVAGLPDIVERNRDAYLLSPGSLLDRSLGRRVHLVRTDKATGKVSDGEALVRSGADGAVILQTEAGFEALRCTGLAETLAYDRIPPDLSARPTLSVHTRSERPVTATVTLSYLATGFDWRANYVATLAPSGDRLELRAWLTLASSDETGFPHAQTQAVAGRLNWSGERAPPVEWRPLTLDCWPQSSTSDIPETLESLERIVVTGSRIRANDIGLMAAAAPPPPPPAPPMMAQQETLGDLKLFRIPEPVTVAARSQKQVALLARPSVRVRTVYRRRLSAYDQGSATAERVLLARNVASEGLGLPLPAGHLALFSSGGARPILLGEADMDDRAVGEDVEIALGGAPGIVSQVRRTKPTAERTDIEIEVTNDRAEAIAFEALLDVPANQIVSDRPLSRRNGRPTLAFDVPANGSTTARISFVTPH